MNLAINLMVTTLSPLMGNSHRKMNKKGKQVWPSGCRISVTSRECLRYIPFGTSFLCPFSDHLLVKIWPNNSDQLPKYRQISHKVERKKHYQVKFIGNATKGKSYNFLKISMKNNFKKCKISRSYFMSYVTNCIPAYSEKL